jgi:hypothetical protein
MAMGVGGPRFQALALASAAKARIMGGTRADWHRRATGSTQEHVLFRFGAGPRQVFIGPCIRQHGE